MVPSRNIFKVYRSSYYLYLNCTADQHDTLLKVNESSEVLKVLGLIFAKKKKKSWISSVTWINLNQFDSFKSFDSSQSKKNLTKQTVVYAVKSQCGWKIMCELLNLNVYFALSSGLFMSLDCKRCLSAKNKNNLKNAFLLFLNAKIHYNADMHAMSVWKEANGTHNDRFKSANNKTHLFGYLQQLHVE